MRHNKESYEQGKRFTRVMLCIYLMAVLLTTGGWAQNGRVSGVVTIWDSDRPLPNVNVEVTGTERAFRTLVLRACNKIND